MASDDYPAGELPPEDPEDEPTAKSAGDEDHADPDELRGGEADPPRDPDEPFEDGADKHAEGES
jgi:hypothetical protein